MEDVIKQLKKGLNIKVFETDEGNTYSGIVLKVDTTQIHLEKCVEEFSKRLQNGVQTFDFDELDRIEIVNVEIQKEMNKSTISKNVLNSSSSSSNIKEEVKPIEKKTKAVLSSEDTSDDKFKVNHHPTDIFTPSKKRYTAKKDSFLTKNQNENTHLKRLTSINMEELLSQKQVVSAEIPILSMVSGTPRIIPSPVQDASHQEGDKFKERESPEFKALRQHIWLDPNVTPKLFFIPEKFYVLTDGESPEYYEAINLIKRFNVIGMGFEGQFLGRDGTLSLLSISTSDGFVYVFDIIRSGYAALHNGILDILMNRNICKVIHDSRKMSDYFHHKFDVQPQNIWDTLAAHICFTSWAVFNGHVPKYDFSISHVAKAYLGIKALSLFFPHYREQHLKKDTGVWLERPISDDLLLGAVRNVMYLLDLQKMTRDAMMLPFKRTSLALLSSIRDAEMEEAYRLQHDNQVLPESVIDALPDWRKRDIHIRYGIVDPSDPNRIHNCVGQLDPKLIFSRDTMHMNDLSNYM